MLAAMLAAAWWCIWLWRKDSAGDPEHLIVSGTVEGRVIEAGSRVGGRIAAVHIQEGDRVEAGSLLATLEGDELAAQREKLLSIVAQAKAQVEKLNSGPRAVDLAQAAAGVEVAKAQLAELEAGTRSEDVAAAKAAWESALAFERQAQADLERCEKLFAGGVIALSQVEQARTAAETARQRTLAARQQYNKAIAGPRQEQLEAARAQLQSAEALYAQLAAGARKEDLAAAIAAWDGAKAELEMLDTRIRELEITAPAAGTVLSLSHESGDLVGPGEALCSILLDGSFYVQVFIPEDKLSWAMPGTMAKLAVDSLPGESIEGEVTFLASQGEFTPRNLQTKEKRVEQVFRCKLAVSGMSLRPGMACDVAFSRPFGAGHQ